VGVGLQNVFLLLFCCGGERFTVKYYTFLFTLFSYAVFKSSAIIVLNMFWSHVYCTLFVWCEGNIFRYKNNNVKIILIYGRSKIWHGQC